MDGRFEQSLLLEHRDLGQRTRVRRGLRVAALTALSVAGAAVVALLYVKPTASPASPPLRGERAPDFLGLYAHVGKCPGDRVHDVVFHIVPKDQDGFERIVLDLADPKSPNFRKWLTSAQVRTLTYNEDGMQAVREALDDLGGNVSIMEETFGGGFLRARAPIAVWEAFLDSEFHLYKYHDGGVNRARAASYTLPTTLHGHVAGVLGVLDLEDRPHDVLAVRPEPVSNVSTTPLTMPSILDEISRSYITPAKLRNAYNLPPMGAKGSLEAKRGGATSQAVFASLRQSWSESDRNQFESIFNLPKTAVHELDRRGRVSQAAMSDLKCEVNPSSCMEANLDVQYMLAMSPWSQTGLYYMGDVNVPLDQDLFTLFAQQLDNMQEPPRVMSISYGGPEIARSKSMIDSFDHVASKIAAQGVTIIASSGDDGANGLGPFQPDASCDQIKAIGKRLAGDVETDGFSVNWPASSPWVTGVGATMGVESGSPEIACATDATGPAATKTIYSALITSGGGYSARVKKPLWQTHDKSMRGVPDVALAGHAYPVVVGGNIMFVDGTSASAPAYAGTVALLNAEINAKNATMEELPTCAQELGASCNIYPCGQSHGPAAECVKFSSFNHKCVCKPGFCAVDGICKSTPRHGRTESVGFLNPVLYANPDAFKDITHGSNKCGRKDRPCCGGYEAGPGWDPVTGLGVVDGKKVIEIMAGAGMSQPRRLV